MSNSCRTAASLSKLEPEDFRHHHHGILNPLATMVEGAGLVPDFLEEAELQASKSISEFMQAQIRIKILGARWKDITFKFLSIARKTDSRMQHHKCGHNIFNLSSDAGRNRTSETDYHGGKIA